MDWLECHWNASTACHVILSVSEESHALGNEILRSTLRMTMGAFRMTMGALDDTERTIRLSSPDELIWQQEK